MRNKTLLGPHPWKKITTIIFLFFLSNSCLAGTEETFTVERLFQQLKRTEPVLIDFVEIKTLSILDINLEQKGELEFRPPDYLRKELIDPIHEKTTVLGERITVLTQDDERILNFSDHPVVAAFISAFRAPLSGNLTEAQVWFKLQLEGNEASWQLILTPNKAPLNKYLSEILLSGRQDLLQTIETIEINNDSTIMILSHK